MEEDGTTYDRLSKTEFDTETELVGKGIRKQGAKKFSKSDELRIGRSRKSARPRFNIQYSSTKVKTRNLQTNLSYRWYNLKDEKESFYIDLFSYLLLHLNPISLDRKLDSDFERNQLKMIWDVCVPRNFKKYIFEKDNFVELSKQGLTYQKANDIELNFIEKDKQNIYLLKIAVKNNLQTIQSCYSTLYPKIYARTNSFGIDNKANFDFILMNRRKIKMLYHLLKLLEYGDKKKCDKS